MFGKYFAWITKIILPNPSNTKPEKELKNKVTNADRTVEKSTVWNNWSTVNCPVATGDTKYKMNWRILHNNKMYPATVSTVVKTGFFLFSNVLILIE